MNGFSLELPMGIEAVPLALVALVAVLLSIMLLRGGRKAARDSRSRHPRTHAAHCILAARAVSKAYRTSSGQRVEVLRNVTIDIPADGLTALIGPSGTGKSTLLNLLGGLDTPDQGQIVFQGTPLPTRECDALRQYRAHRVAWIFQDLNLITHLTAEQNIALPLLRQGLARSTALRLAREALEALGMPSRLARRRPAQLSGGERQRVAIARAMVGDAEVFLADEPTGSLDPEHAEEVLKILRDVVDQRGIPVVMVTHNLGLADRYADRILEMGAGGEAVKERGQAASRASVVSGVSGRCPPSVPVAHRGGATGARQEEVVS